MKQLTVRGVTDEVGKRLDLLARERGTSVNSIVLEILERAVGVQERREHLTRYMTWTDGELKDFEVSLQLQRGIEHEVWEQ